MTAAAAHLHERAAHRCAVEASIWGMPAANPALSAPSAPSDDAGRVHLGDGVRVVAQSARTSSVCSPSSGAPGDLGV